MDTLSQTIRKFNRFELKYLVSLKQAEEIKQILRGYMLPDTFSSESGRYTVTSLYYDSPQYHCYWEKENGVMFRRKLRIRHYESVEVITDETPVFVEIKQRIDRVVQKRRAVLPYVDALHLCNDRQVLACDPLDQGLVEEVYVFLWQYNLIPKSIVRYERQAFIGTIYDAGMRITFDTDLSFQVHPLHLHEMGAGLPMLSPSRVVMEIKVNERMPYWLTEFIAAHNLQMLRISKYCCSVEAAWKMPQVQHHDLLAESAQEALSSSFSIPLFWKEICQSNENKN